jgi:hypothetical protein
MGTWGTAISSNDTYADIYSEFCDLYNEGVDINDITNRLISKNQETINDPDDANNFWFAIAKAQWDYKKLDSKILLKIKVIVESGQDLRVWEEIGADKKQLKKREEVLAKFLAMLNSEKTRAKAKKKIIVKEPLFEKGDCLIFKLPNGNYGGAVVLEAKQSPHFTNLIAATRINQSERPTIKDFEQAEILIMNSIDFSPKKSPMITWCYSGVSDIELLIDVLKSIKVEYEYNSAIPRYFYSKEFRYTDMLMKEIDFEKNNTRSVKMTVKSLTNKKKWKFW